MGIHGLLHEKGPLHFQCLNNILVQLSVQMPFNRFTVSAHSKDTIHLEVVEPVQLLELCNINI